MTSHEDGKRGAARRSAKLWRVLVAGGMSMAAACAGMHGENSSGSGNGTQSGTAGGSAGASNSPQGGGASGW